jgi:hypothetical protein
MRGRGMAGVRVGVARALSASLAMAVFLVYSFSFVSRAALRT